MADVAPPGSPQAPQGGSAGGSNKTLMIIGAIVLLVAVAVGAFFVGKAKGEDDIKSQYKAGEPKYNAIYSAGQNAGQATGETQGQETGEAEGKTKGKKVGLEQGEQQGEVTGANDVFDAYSSWDVGSFYIVQIGEGTDGVNYTLENRTSMVEGEDYKLCADDPGSICVVTPSGSGGGSGGSGG